ncbi:glycosyl hydrolase 53 family protein [Bifidobacterium vansinderenii]|uniref:Arabinogalactan endo-beta-1,4-galactanase n=1 Tax=Bifidobacterium vansinderenii TaxID=1984871 RepID=A0A229VVS0_9BIFI|nr:glycosyl hydrolase 53 family protein [Bifidobacterium vansinderenii]OXM99718.1 cell wall-binding repeat protein [Bifidobacterium vansinderenii]
MSRKPLAAVCAAVAALSMLVPASMASAADASGTASNATANVGQDYASSSAAKRAEAAKNAAAAQQQLLEESSQTPASASPTAENPNYPKEWNEGTDTGVTKLPASVTGVSSMTADTVRGVNLTSYQAEKTAGVKFHDFNGNEIDDAGLMQLLKSSGVNYVLLKVAVNPADAKGNTYGGGNPTLDNALKTAKVAQANGLKVNIQFLYSDFYTSKTVQKLPKGWPTSKDDLKTKVADYTKQSLATLKSGGVTPDMVTIGSEISSPYYDDNKALQGGFLGMDNWEAIAALIEEASKAVSANSKNTTIAVGVSSVTPVLVTTYVDMLKYYEVDYDVLGTKVYAAYDDLAALAQTRKMVSEEYGKSMAVLDTLYPFTQYDSDGQSNTTGGDDLIAAGKTLSPQAQADYMRSLYKSIVSAKNNANGAGVFYGDATWIAVKAGLWHADANWNAANEFGTGWVSKYAADYVDYANNGGASQQDDAALFDDLGQPLQSLKMFAQLAAANPSDADLVPAAQDPYADGSDTGASKETASVKSIPTVTNDTIRGADVSSYQTLYAAGVRFKNFEGKEEPLFKILKDNGMNWVRLRLFNDPKDSQNRYYGGGNNDLKNVTEMAKEATKYGLKVNVDIHYNDFYSSSWRTPKAWKNHDYNQLKTDVADYTAEFMKAMKDNNVDLGMVQIGNESNCGLLGVTVCSNGYSFDKDPNWGRLVELMNSAAKVIRKESPSTQIAVHMMYSDSWTINVIADNFQKYGLDYDVFGMTYYPFWSAGSDNTDSHDGMAALIKSEKVITETYKKKFAVMEFSQPFTTSDSDGFANNLTDGGVSDYAASAQGQADVIHDIMKTVTETDNGTDLGLGAFYWEPAWIAVVPGTNHWQINRTYSNDYGTGWASEYSKDNDPNNTEYDSWGASGWDNQALFDDHGNALQSLKAFTQIIADRTVSFDTQGGDAMQSVTVKDGSTISKPADPVRAGYSFTGWTSDKEGKNAVDFSKPVTGDTTLYAQWGTNSYTVRFHANDGSNPEKTNDQKLAYGKDAELTKNTFTRDGWTFNGWNTKADGTGDSFDDGQKVSNLTDQANGVFDLYAKWTPGVTGLAITANPTKTSYHVGDTFDATGLAVAAKLADGSQRALDPSEYTVSSPDMSTVGTKTVTVTYAPAGSQNGKQTATFDITVEPGDRNSLQNSLNAADKLNENDYTADSWKALADARENARKVLADQNATDKQIQDAAAMLGEATSKLVRAYTVRFDSRGGSSTAEQKVAEGKKAEKPADPTRSGYTFTGWTTDAEGRDAYDFNTAVTADVQLYAQWKNIVAVAAPDAVSTPARKAPTLPKTVEVTWSDGKTAKADVKWDAVAKSQYAQVGPFDVRGTIDGWDQGVTVHVNVTIGTGTYAIATALNGGERVFDIPGGSTAARANVQLYDRNGTAAQKYRVTALKNGNYTIVNQGSRLPLAYSLRAGNGSRIQQREGSDTYGTEWRIDLTDDGSFTIRPAANGLENMALDVPGANNSNGSLLQLWSFTQDGVNLAQRWKFLDATSPREKLDRLADDHRDDLKNGTYTVSSALKDSAVLDVTGGSTGNGANVQLYGSNGTDAQIWKVTHDDDGYVTLKNANSGKVLDVSGGSANNGANVQQYDSNGTYAQKWVAVKSGSAFKLVSALSPNLVIDVSGGSSANGANVQIWDSNDTKAQRWSFSAAKTLRTRIDELAAEHKSDVAEGTYEIASTAKDSMRFDVVGASRDDGANVQLYGANGTNAQRWKVSIDAKGYATLTNVASGKVLDISGASTAEGANVQQYGSNGSWAQKWILKKNANGSITLISALRENFVIDAAGGGTTNGTNIQMWSSNGSAAQRWTFVKK